MMEIARAVHHKDVIIFDEPTPTLTTEEKRHFFALMRRLKASGVSIIFATHALEAALSHANHISILRDGELIETGPAAEFDRNKVVRAMVGCALTDKIYNKKRWAADLRRFGRQILSVRSVSMGSMVRNNSFSIFAGQVTGVFGTVGSGLTETFKIIAGIYNRDFLRGGEIKFDAA